jgi:alkanesulfonate monooxygenase SsuD/methylene tetrahydromethanopterin reductase-like flavin-dependent oxidoreductase (luciferase family)
MKFGIFDYLDRRDEPLSVTYDRRLELVRSAEDRGFTGYHVTEHHVTPLSPTPSPSVFLAACARETRRIRLGALLWLLPLYNPLRLVEELAMLDHLSHGRLDIGVGRGISPHEFAAMGVDFDEADARFEDAFAVLLKGLTQETIDHHGPFYDYDDVPVVFRPVQQPHPPLWYGLRSTEGHDRPARHRMNAVTLGPTEKVARTVANYRAALRRHGGAAEPEPLIGAMRAMFIADTDPEAERFARPAYRHWFDSLVWLWERRGDRIPIAISADYDEAVRDGTLVVGGPDTVRRTLMEQLERIGFTYLVLQLAFGTLGHAHEMRSLDLFARHVMPALAAETARA